MEARDPHETNTQLTGHFGSVRAGQHSRYGERETAARGGGENCGRKGCRELISCLLGRIHTHTHAQVHTRARNQTLANNNSPLEETTPAKFGAINAAFAVYGNNGKLGGSRGCLRGRLEACCVYVTHRTAVPAP